ncbi:MAG: hypothetical protein IPK10_14775 [Bacteroidetes bacterium]|nr:hypothetical protein [Bacteroidota bacterium]
MTLLPLLVEKIVYEHIDKRLVARSERILLTVKRGSIADIVREQDCSFESYNILKEEFVAIYPITDPLKMHQATDIRNETWRIEGENYNIVSFVAHSFTTIRCMSSILEKE